MWWWSVGLAAAQMWCADPEVCFAEGVRQQVELGDYEQAALAFEGACLLEHQRSCANLGAMAERGLGVPKDLTRAWRLYRGACDAGLGMPCAALGTLYANGAGVPQDDAKALQLFELSCGSGHAQGCTHYARMLDGGFGTERDWLRAEALYDKACTAGDGDACSRLAARYHSIGRPELLARLPGLLTKACDADQASSCGLLADLTEQGVGVTKDRQRAEELRAKACRLGESAACR